MGQIITTFKLTTLEETVDGAKVCIANVPAKIRRGGGRPGVREYFTSRAVDQVFFLCEVARMRAAAGETDIRLDFKDDASAGRHAFAAYELALRERRRRHYHARVHRRSARF
jgi:hypothetical protein